MIRVSDIKKSLDFYQNILGLKLSRTKELSDATLYFLTDETCSCEIELTHNHTLPEDGYTLGSAFGHFAFETDDMNKFSELIKNKGIEYTWKPFKITPTGSTIAFIKDPDGYQIEIIEQK
jgi:lactoylglutathione lyase